MRFLVEAPPSLTSPTLVLSLSRLCDSLTRVRVLVHVLVCVCVFVRVCVCACVRVTTAEGGSEYVQGLTYAECATLLNVDVTNTDLMEQIYDTAYRIKERIYGNRIVLFAPLYIANYCVNNCAYCAFRSINKDIQ
eukprot:6393726-Pyramimonas_sp.AAC.1